MTQLAIASLLMMAFEGCSEAPRSINSIAEAPAPLVDPSAPTVSDILAKIQPSAPVEVAATPVAPQHRSHQALHASKKHSSSVMLAQNKKKKKKKSKRVDEEAVAVVRKRHHATAVASAKTKHSNSAVASAGSSGSVAKHWEVKSSNSFAKAEKPAQVQKPVDPNYIADPIEDTTVADNGSDSQGRTAVDMNEKFPSGRADLEKAPANEPAPLSDLVASTTSPKRAKVASAKTQKKARKELLNPEAFPGTSDVPADDSSDDPKVAASGPDEKLDVPAPRNDADKIAGANSEVPPTVEYPDEEIKTIDLNHAKVASK